VLITKLRSANSVETQQYRKATKALVVLIPLLGVTYILMIAGPTEGLSAAIYAYIRAIMLSTQVIYLHLLRNTKNDKIRTKNPGIFFPHSFKICVKIMVDCNYRVG
jgi:corticotropin releasing hormone receptor 1